MDFLVLFFVSSSLRLSLLVLHPLLTLSYVADWQPFLHLSRLRYDNRKTPKGGNHPCGCLFQSQLAEVVEPPRLKSKTISPRLFPSVRNLLMIALTKLLFGHMYLFKFFLYRLFFFPSLIVALSLHSCRRGLRPRLHRLGTSCLWTLIELVRKFCTRPIMLSIGGSFCVTKLFEYILTTKAIWNLVKAWTSSSSTKAPSLSKALLTGTLSLFFFAYSFRFISFPLPFSYFMFFIV